MNPKLYIHCISLTRKFIENIERTGTVHLTIDKRFSQIYYYLFYIHMIWILNVLICLLGIYYRYAAIHEAFHSRECIKYQTLHQKRWPIDGKRKFAWIKSVSFQIAFDCNGLTVDLLEYNIFELSCAFNLLSIYVLVHIYRQ